MTLPDVGDPVTGAIDFADCDKADSTSLPVISLNSRGGMTSRPEAGDRAMWVVSCEG